MAAAAALRGGGRAVLQLEARGLCTKPVGTGMAPPPQNVAAPQGSTKLLAMKAPVEFRKMLSSSSHLLSADKGESISSTTLKEAAKSDEDTSTPMPRKTQVAFPQRGVVSSREEENLTTPARGGGLRKKLAEDTSMPMPRKTQVAFPQRGVASSREEENLTPPARGGGLRKKLAEDTSMPIPRKTQVAFPQRGVASSREEENLTTPARGGGLRKKLAEDTSMPIPRKTQVAFPQQGVVSSREEENLTSPARGGGLRKKLAEKQSSSSSSSESDSSSDSEDESVGDSKVAAKTKVEFPRRDPMFSENIAVKTSMLAKEKLSQKSLKEYGIKKLPRKPEIDVSPVKQVTFSKTSVSQETSKSKARDPKVKSPPKDQKLGLKPHMLKSLDLTDVTAKSDHVEKKPTGPQGAAIQLKASAVTQEDKKQDLLSRGEKEKMKKAPELKAKEVTALKVEEASGSPALVMATPAKEKTMQEAGAQAGESSTTQGPAQPPDEELDSSTYKNLQHHDYHTFTFHDYVAILAKYRQPQPSSGRPSPRH